METAYYESKIFKYFNEKSNNIFPQKNIFSGKLVDGGLVILSKYPIVKVRKFNFDSKSSSYDSLVHKGFLNALIQIGNKKISIYNLHNQSFYQKFVKKIYKLANKKKKIFKIKNWAI